MGVYDLWNIKKGAIENIVIKFAYKYALDTPTVRLS